MIKKATYLDIGVKVFNLREQPGYLKPVIRRRPVDGQSAIVIFAVSKLWIRLLLDVS